MVRKDLRQRMDVRFCESGNHCREAIRASCGFCQKFAVRAPPKRASGVSFFSLTMTYMDVGIPNGLCFPSGLGI
jgi:hypothetical protein